MKFMSGSPVMGDLVRRMASSEWRTERNNYSPLATRRLNPRHIELRLLAGAIAAQGAIFADGVGALEDPVLPRGEAREDLRFHGLGSNEAQIGFHPGEAVGRKTGAFLEEHPHLVVPIDIVEREGDEAEFFRLLRIERLADR